jgi:TRAP-type uncharacterized transport system substrate-binding protein
MARLKFRKLTLTVWSVSILSILVALLFLSWMSYNFLEPFPPKTLVMATGTESGSYAAFGERYREALARDGIKVVLRPTSGAVENLKLLLEKTDGVQAGFVQSTVGRIDESTNLVSLGGVAYTPLWIFYRSKDTYDDLIHLQGKRIAIGPEGSGVQQFSIELLKVAGVTAPPAALLNLPYEEAKKALFEGRIDAIMSFGAPDNRLIWEWLESEDIKLLSLGQAEAYARRFPDLSHVVLPKGVIDPSKRRPADNVDLLSPTTNLIVRKDLHPALVYLLLKASAEIHGPAGWVNKAGEFPTLVKQDDPISNQAQRFYKSGGSWLYAYLPFWAATFVERLSLIMIPLGVVLLPLIGLLPWIYTWRNRSKMYPHYRDLRALEQEILENKTGSTVDEFISRLDRIEDSVSRVHTSVAFYDELFILKEHLQIVRLRLDSLASASHQKGDTACQDK